MRAFFRLMLAMLPASLFIATGANAANETWRQSCIGPEHACSAPQSAKPSTKAVAVKTSKAKSTAEANDETPVKAKKKAKIAAKPDDGDEPAAKPKKKAKAIAKASDDDEPVAKPKKKAKVVAKASDDDEPVAKPKKKAKVAAKSDDDEQPAAKPKKKAKVAAKSDDDDEAPQKKSNGGGSVFQSGMASWYGGNFHGRKTANGETYDMWDMTAAHPSLPFGTRVRVTNTRNGDSVTVRINDRGPFVGGRIIDLSAAAAGDLGMTNSGVAPVKLTILGKG